MILSPQAVVDDSGSEPQSQFFVLAGFIASADSWAAFSDEWQSALDQKPRLEYFKMKEAVRLKDQFDEKRGWTEELRDERIDTLTQIITRRAAIRIHAKIQHAHFNKHIRSLLIPNRKLFSDSPYTLLFFQLILAVAIQGDRYGLMTPCDFIFDEQEGFSAEIQSQWPTFKETIRSSSKVDLPALVGDMPVFRNENCFLPLQAADLYAWQMRNYFKQNRRIIVPANRVLRQFVGVPMIERIYEEDEIIRLREHLLAVGENLKAINPEQKLLAYANTRNERRRARKTSHLFSKK